MMKNNIFSKFKQTKKTVVVDNNKSPMTVIAEAQADFALNLLRKLSNNGAESTIVSPSSVAIALAMVYAGAKQKTSQEMGQLLANGASEQTVHEYFGHMLKLFQDDGPQQQQNCTLELANKVYMADSFTVLDTFQMAINEHYGGGQFETVDFTERIATAQKINRFVEQATHDKIHYLIEPEQLTNATRLILLNAVYFKGIWAEKFDAKDTKKLPFYVSKNSQKELQVLGMPYVGEKVYAFILLPKQRFGLAKMLKKLNGKKLLEFVQINDYKRKVEVTLPKFKLESMLPLNKPLQKLGMSTAFTDSANFGGICAKQQGLMISDVLQKAFIEFNEEGTEVVAATESVGMRAFGLYFSTPTKTPIFNADHPFALSIVLATQNSTPIVLFSGVFHG